MAFRTKLIQLFIDINEKIIFYPKLKRFYSVALKNKLINIIDVGTNKGQSIDFFLKINQQAIIFGFEPNKKLFQKLLVKYSSNSNIRLHNKGISDTSGKLTFHENILDETSTFQEVNTASVYLAKKARVLGVSTEKLIVDSYEVEVTTLDIFLSENPNVYFDVLKIDVEGHELQSLKGLFSNSNIALPIRYIQIESHSDDMYLNNSSADIEALLKNNGFYEVARFKHGFGDFYEIIYENKSNS